MAAGEPWDQDAAQFLGRQIKTLTDPSIVSALTDAEMKPATASKTKSFVTR